MIEYVNLLLLLTMFGSTCYVYYRLKKIFYLISIVMDSEILDQFTDLGRDIDSEFPKPKRGRKKKADTKMNELEDNDVRDKRERLVACILSGNSKMYLGKEYTEQQINEMDYNSINTLLNRYESVLSAQMTKSLGKSIINLYSNLACSVLGVGNQQELSTDLECDPFLNTAMQRFTCNLYYRFGTLLGPVSVGIITGKHYAKNSITKLNDRSNSGTRDPATRNCNQTEEPLRIEQRRKLVEYNKRKKEELKHLNEQITKQDDMADHKPRPDTSTYVYAGSLSVLGLAISGYLLYSKFKKLERNLIDAPPPPVKRLALNQKEIFLKCSKNFYHIIYKWLKTIQKI